MNPVQCRFSGVRFTARVTRQPRFVPHRIAASDSLCFSFPLSLSLILSFSPTSFFYSLSFLYKPNRTYKINCDYVNRLPRILCLVLRWIGGYRWMKRKKRRGGKVAGGGPKRAEWLKSRRRRNEEDRFIHFYYVLDRLCEAQMRHTLKKYKTYNKMIKYVDGILFSHRRSFVKDEKWRGSNLQGLTLHACLCIV